MSHDIGSKKHTTYLELVDTGSSSLLMDKTLLYLTRFKMKTTKEILWDTQAGSFTTDEIVLLTNYCLPQFSMKRKISSILHLFEKHPSHHNYFIIGQNILSGLN
jgi:hypothetical protein